MRPFGLTQGFRGIESDLPEEKKSLVQHLGADNVQVEISCRHGSTVPVVTEQIRHKAEKLLTFFERVTAIGVTLDFTAEGVKAEILVDAEHKHNFVSLGVAPDALTAFELSLAKMEQQIRKYKEKVQDHRRDQPLAEYAKTDDVESN